MASNIESSLSKKKNILDCSLIELPDLEYPDIYNYLIDKPGKFCLETSPNCMVMN